MAYLENVVSVIIPFYKELDLIKRAVDSALGQSLPSSYDIEVVISNDGTIENDVILRRLNSSDSRISIVKNEFGSGAGPARNNGIRHSRGIFIAFLDADDFWLPNKLSTQLEFISDFNFICTGYILNGKLIVPPKAISNQFQFLCNTNVGTSTVLLNRNLLGDRCFSSRKSSQDTELWSVLASLDSFKFKSIDLPLANYEPSSRTSNKFKELFRFLTLLFDLKVNPFAMGYILCCYSFKGLRRHFF